MLSLFIYVFCCFFGFFGWWFYDEEEEEEEKKVMFISLYLLICNILCFTVSYLIRCVVVTACKTILFREFPNHDKRQKQSQNHNLPFCSYETCCHFCAIAPRVRKFKDYECIRDRCMWKVRETLTPDENNRNKRQPSSEQYAVTLVLYGTPKCSIFNK